MSTFRLYSLKVSRIRARYIRLKASTGLAIRCHGWRSALIGPRCGIRQPIEVARELHGAQPRSSPVESNTVGDRYYTSSGANRPAKT
jgi:hypothetical protein